VLAEKFTAKGLDLGRVRAAAFRRRRREFESDWEQNLIHLVPPPAQLGFEDAWRTADQAIAHIAALA